jgi:hypothetical protein
VPPKILVRKERNRRRPPCSPSDWQLDHKRQMRFLTMAIARCKKGTKQQGTSTKGRLFDSTPSLSTTELRKIRKTKCRKGLYPIDQMDKSTSGLPPTFSSKQQLSHLYGSWKSVQGSGDNLRWQDKIEHVKTRSIGRRVSGLVEPQTRHRNRIVRYRGYRHRQGFKAV